MTTLVTEPDHFSFVDAGDGYCSLPITTVELARLTVANATRLEADAEIVADLALTADVLLDGVHRLRPSGLARDAAQRLRNTVRGAALRSASAADTARRTIGRTISLIDVGDVGDVDDDEDDERYEEILTARLHVPIAASLVDDAMADALPAFRHLARLALATGLADGDDGLPLQRMARGVLRRPLPGGRLPRLCDEPPVLWSVTLDELRLEMAGLLANMLVDHRTYLIAAHAGRANRFVQALTFDADLHVESVEDQFLPDDEQLTEAEVQRLRELGWLAPDAAARLVNWRVDFEPPVDVHAAADLLVSTLVDVHGLDSPLDLHLTIHESVDPFDH